MWFVTDQDLLPARSGESQVSDPIWEDILLREWPWGSREQWPYAFEWGERVLILNGDGRIGSMKKDPQPLVLEPRPARLTFFTHRVGPGCTAREERP
jgi:hypothetical protein